MKPTTYRDFVRFNARIFAGKSRKRKKLYYIRYRNSPIRTILPDIDELKKEHESKGEAELLLFTKYLEAIAESILGIPADLLQKRIETINQSKHHAKTNSIFKSI